MTTTGRARNETRPLIAALCVALILPLTGCGFTPLYADNQTGGSLRDIRVEVGEHSRSNFLLQERLSDAFGRANGPGSWLLTVTSVKHRYPRGVRVNNVATRYELDLVVSFVLKDAASGKVALRRRGARRLGGGGPDPAASVSIFLGPANAAILSKRADVERFLAHPPPELPACLLFGKDSGGVKERAHNLA
eukprot:gene13104-15122_t